MGKICKKASERLYFLSQFKRAKVQRKDLVTFYVTCIRPVLTCACEVYSFNLQEKQKSSLQGKSIKIQLKISASIGLTNLTMLSAVLKYNIITDMYEISSCILFSIFLCFQ